METLVLVIHCLVASMMVGLILLQQGKGAEAGASFGAGASQTVFGAAGAASFLTKLTAWLAGIFMVTSLTLAVYARKDVQAHNQIVVPAALTAPAVPSAPSAPARPVVPGLGDLPQLPVH
ncbi:MAG: preprotein translocase subunit SecG [Pseudomonadales bacterium]|nr:preprotein translocase subunit SecG [Pseudomonadales bacterium]